MFTFSLFQHGSYNMFIFDIFKIRLLKSQRPLHVKWISHFKSIFGSIETCVYFFITTLSKDINASTSYTQLNERNEELT